MRKPFAPPRFALAALALGLAACGSTVGNGHPTVKTSSSGSSGGSGSTGGAGSSGGSGSTGSQGPANDFPATAVVLDGLPLDVSTLFSAAPDAGSDGPCLAEPTLDAMIPRNWLPLRLEWTPAADENVFEIRLHVINQANDFLAYTSQSSFTLDATIWRGLTTHSAGQDIAVTLRGATYASGAFSSGPDLGASGLLHLAPVDAPGTVVYWTSSNGTAFEGFSIGDATSTVVLDPALAGPTSTGSTTTCVACHASSPDGNLVIYTRDAADGTREIDARTVAGALVPGPTDISAAALQLLGREKNTAPTLSAAHYGAGDAVVVSVFQDATLTGGLEELIWTDLHATAADTTGWGIIQRAGDVRQAASPAWRHDGTAIAYVSAANVGEGVISSGSATDPDYDIYVVPYDGGAGGDAVPLVGASDPAFREFYPVYSPGDSLVAFNRSSEAVNSYDQPSAEVCVVPGAGGLATRLRANDPPACTGLGSPGITNSWARWAPSAETVNGKRYYWLVFSSKRRPSSVDATGALAPQLFVAAIVTNVDGGAETLSADYPALYVGSQDPTQSNHTPAWDVFQLR